MGRDHHRRPNDRKQRQLCAQVAEAIDLALGESTDSVLQGCWVVDVRPGPDQARLRVRVQTADQIDIRDFEKRLERATPWLRTQVAEYISRRKVPSISLVWAGPPN